MMKDIEIKINRETRMVDLSKSIIGNDGENLQGNLVFSFADDFVKGQARLEYVIDSEKKYALLLKDEDNYYIPIKSVMTKAGTIDMQLVITEGTNENEIPIFKSNMFYVTCRTSINAEIEEEEGYYSWIEIANTKLNEVDEAIEELASQSNYAKEQGDYAKEQANNIIKANVEASKIIDKFEDNVNEYTTAFDNNASEKLKSYNDNYVAKTNKFDDNYDNKVSQFNDNAVNKINDYNSNAEQKIVEYDKHSEELNNKIEEVKKAIPEKVSELENDLNYVKNTDYATNSAGGVIKANVGLFVDAKGYVGVKAYDYEEYKSKTNNYFVGKGTLENVIKGKKLETANNKVTSISPNSTDEQYPSAKCTYKIKKGLETLKNEVLETGTSSDTFIHVEDSAMAEMQELSIDGVCCQKTTTGKNLLPNNATSQTINGIVYTVNSDGSVYVKGTATARSEFDIYNKTFKLKANTEYKFQTDILMTLQISTGYISGAKGKTFTSESEISVYRAYIRVENGTTIDKTIYPMITLSNQNDTYEPYTGGKPSPSPDYPQEIKTITDSLSVTSCNKNLLKLTTFTDGTKTQTKNGVTATINDDGTITCKGTATNKTTFYLQKNYLGFTLGDGCFLCNSPSANQRVEFICSIDGIEKYLSSYGTCNFINAKTSFEFRQVLIIIEKGENVDITFTPMFAKGTIVASYEEHIQSQITANLPEGEFIGKIDETYKDTLNVVYKDDGQYHLVLNKMVGKVVLDGADTGIKTISSWDTTTLNGSYQASFSNLLTKQTNSEYVAISNYFDKGLLADRVNKTNIIYTYTDGVLRIATNVATTKAGFLTWLSTHNTEVYYVLATPYVLDLGIVDQLITYNEITNLFTDSDLLPIINATYYRNFIKTVQNLQVNEKALKQELIDINNRLTALETAKSNESEVNNDIPVE